MVRESEALYQAAHERKHEVLPTLLELQENYVETGHYYVQIVDYLDEVAKALVHITRPSFDHINNNHEGFRVGQLEDLKRVNEQVSTIYTKINEMLRTNRFEQLDEILRLRDELFDTLAAAIKSQIKRVKAKASTTRSMHTLPDDHQRNQDDGAAKPESAQIAEIFPQQVVVAGESRYRTKAGLAAGFFRGIFVPGAIFLIIRSLIGKRAGSFGFG